MKLRLTAGIKKAANHQVNESLSSLAAQDQSARNEYTNFVKSQAGGDWPKWVEMAESGDWSKWDEMAEMYAKLKNRPIKDIFGDVARLNPFMKMEFDFDKFTDEDWDNYWLLAQHCDYNLEFQKKALSIIKKYLGEEHLHYQFLFDRISISETGEQKYETQNMEHKIPSR